MDTSWTLQPNPDLYIGIVLDYDHLRHPNVELMRSERGNMNSKKLWVFFGSINTVLLIGLIVLGTVQFRHQRATDDRLDKLDRMREGLRHFMDSQLKVITPEVGMIEFIERGFSIEIESAKYTQEGLYLKGYLGNPTNLWIYNLTLTFRAVRVPTHDEWLKTKKFEPKEIGVGQTSPITILEPGKRQLFEVTIPNVKQVSNKSERPRITVDFSGERYSYGR